MRTAEICAGLSLLLAAGCHVWQERPVTTPAPTPVAHRLRATIDRGARRLTLDGATVRPDSIVGVLIEAADRRGGDWVVDRTTPAGGPVAIATTEVWSLEERNRSPARTTILLASFAALTAVLITVLYGLAVLASEDT